MVGAPHLILCNKTLTENWDSERHLLELFGLFRDYDLNLEIVSKELNHLAAILHVYAGSLSFMK